jgi:hypothetical protein
MNFLDITPTISSWGGVQQIISYIGRLYLPLPFAIVCFGLAILLAKLFAFISEFTKSSSPQVEDVHSSGEKELN